MLNVQTHEDVAHARAADPVLLLLQVVQAQDPPLPPHEKDPQRRLGQDEIPIEIFRFYDYRFDEYNLDI